MRNGLSLMIMAGVLASGLTSAHAAPPPPDEKGKTCRMEQQCRWENFKKICVYVKVCR